MGVSKKTRSEKFTSQMSIYDASINKPIKKYLGDYNTPEEAFNIYKEFKEDYIRQVANEYKNKIPKRLYDAMYRYKIEITD